MTRILALLVIAIAPSFAFTAPMADFFVAPNGNDAWSGTLAAPNRTRTDGPFASLTRARDAARRLRTSVPAVRPITVLVRGGDYPLAQPLTFTPADSGSEVAPLQFHAYPDETPILSGGVSIAPKVEGDVWVIPVPKEIGAVRHLSVNGEWRRASRWPKSGEFTIAGLAGADPKSNYRSPADRFEYAAGQIDPQWPNLTDAEVVVLHFWVAGRYRIQGVDASSRVVTLDRPSIRRFTEDHSPAKMARFYLTNAPVALEAGEFFHDRQAGLIRYKPKPGEMPMNTRVIVPRLDVVLRFDGKPAEGQFVEHVHLRGLTVADSRFDIGDKVAGDLQAAQNVTGAVRLRGARHCTIADCRLLNLDGYALELGDGCRGNRVIGNEIAFIGAGGIRCSGGAAGSPMNVRTGENQITDNHIHHLGEMFPAGVGVLVQHADKMHIAHNHIHHLYYTGISVGWVWGYAESVSRDNIVEKNLVHDIGQKVLSDMGGIYMLGVSPGTVVRGNIVRDVDSFGYGGWGIYTDEGSTGITIEKNLVYRTKSGGFHQHYGKDNIIRNNIFALAREGLLMRTRTEPHRSFTLERNIVFAHGTPLFAKNWKDDGFTVDRNLYWDATEPKPLFAGKPLADWQKRGHDTHSLIADPHFMDPAKGDFRLHPDSPAKQIGFEPFDVSMVGVRPQTQRK